ncbi:50S ribosomal protein L9 [soil metagenome]
MQGVALPRGPRRALSSNIMKVILTQDVENLGARGDAVQVKPGYGRNFLIPRSLAVVANPSNVRRYEEERRQQGRKIEQKRKETQALTERLEGLELTISVRTGEENRIFGTITTQQIADLLAQEGIEVDRRKIDLVEDIRTTGVYSATVRVDAESTATLKVKVVPEQESIQ